MTKIFCLADICLVPIGTPTTSVSSHVARVIEVFRDSGLKYTLHSAGTTIEGPWDEVMATIGKAHEAIHEMGILRIQSDIRVGTRTDKHQTPEDKVNSVLEKLSKK